jgi:hypothetical protein
MTSLIGWWLGGCRCAAADLPANLLSDDLADLLEEFAAGIPPASESEARINRLALSPNLSVMISKLSISAAPSF